MEPAASRLSPGAAVGAVVGRYRLLGSLGEGGMGVVYRAEDTTLGRHAALKFLPVHLAASGEAAARLLAEARAASALDHPHICTIYEVGEAEDGRVFIAMACYEGESLADRIQAGPIAAEEAVRIAAQTASALEAAHARGIVHRDIKPSNIFLTTQGAVKLLDFGVAKVDGEALTRTGDTLGTIQYMAPEQTRGVADARGDLWALGAVLYEMIVGERLFSGSYDGALLFDILYMDIDLAPVERAGAPSSVASIIGQCLQRDPEARVPSATALREALEGAFAAGAPADVPAIPPASTAPGAFAPSPRGEAVPASTVPDPSGPTAAAAPTTAASPVVLAPPSAAVPVVPEGAASGGERRRVRWPVAAGVAAALAVGAVGAWALAGSSEAEPAGGGEFASSASTERVEMAAAAGGATPDSSAGVLASEPPEAGTADPLPEAAPIQAAPVQSVPTVIYRDRPAPLGAPPPGPAPQRQAAPSPQPATLISQAGPGISVSVGGRPVNGALSVEPGTHTVVFRHPRYGEVRRTVRTGAGESVGLAIHFEAEVRVGAQLASGSGPAPFAAVWVDGRNTGAFTPTTLTLGPGRHTIELRRDGYAVLDSPQTVTVEPSASPTTQSVSFRLAPQ